MKEGRWLRWNSPSLRLPSIMIGRETLLSLDKRWETCLELLWKGRMLIGMIPRMLTSTAWIIVMRIHHASRTHKHGRLHHVTRWHRVLIIIMLLRPPSLLYLFLPHPLKLLKIIFLEALLVEIVSKSLNEVLYDAVVEFPCFLFLVKLRIHLFNYN